MHVPLHVHIEISKDVVTGLTVSFRAPYGITDARHEYGVLLPQRSCNSRHQPEELGGTGFALARDVRLGATVSTFIAYPFRVSHICGKKEVEVDILYRGAEERGVTIVGKATVRQPPHTKNGTRRR